MKKRRHILSLRPTQFCVGACEIEIKTKEIERRSGKYRKRYLKDLRIPVVVSPDSKMYIIDHHHHALAAWRAGVKKVVVTIIKDFSKEKFTTAQFWKVMEKNHWVHLYDQFGGGPHHPVYLPDDVSRMVDDPYRGLAWEVRQAGGFERSQELYSEFRWADFFRKKRLLLSFAPDNFEKAVKKGISLARSKIASHLPGHIGQKKPKKRIR